MLVVVVVLAAGLLTALVALVAWPYLLVRHLRGGTHPAPTMRFRSCRRRRASPVTQPVGPGLIHLSTR